MNILISLPNSVSYLLKILHQHGYEAYVIGGCVRDSLLGIQPKDWDITTNATTLDIKEILLNNNIKVVETGIEFGTITAILDKEPFEITTYRSDSIESDGRKPNEVTFVKSLKEDVLRRDLTINALAYNEEEGLMDYVNGYNDLLNRKIRFIGDIESRLKEDILRCLRAFRFSYSLRFSMDNNTRNMCYNYFKKYNSKLSIERIRDEILKIFSCNDLEDDFYLTFLPLLSETIIPEISGMVGCTQNNKHHKYDVFGHTVGVMRGCNHYNDYIIMMAALLHDIGKPLVKTVREDGTEHFIGHAEQSVKISNIVLRRLKFTNEERMKITQLVEVHDMFNQSVKISSVRRFMSNLSLEQLERYKILRKADIDAQVYHQEKEDRYIQLLQYIKQVQNEGSMFKLSDLKINGNDILNLGIKNKVHIKYILEDILVNCYGNPSLNNREWLLKYAKKLVRRWNTVQE